MTTAPDDVVIEGDTLRIGGETLEKLEELACLLGTSPYDALRIAVREALERPDVKPAI